MVALMTDAQSEMTDLISYIPHPAEVLGHSNDQHARLLAAVKGHDAATATQLMAEHLAGTEHVLAGLLPG
ncbi:MAG: FCD domain-containing protein [Actinobacteria bacterium]|nr:MAG: FCD domain-containing protein [Actinomycetota bacterium]